MHRITRVAALLGVLVLAGGVAAQGTGPTANPATFSEVMDFIAAELDTSADQALQATSQQQLQAALDRMDWAYAQLEQLDLPMTTEACSVRATLAQWADFQRRAFANYPDRTYDYLYHDARARFMALRDALPAVAAAQPYALVSRPGEPAVAAAPAAAGEAEADTALVGALAVAARYAVPGRDTTRLVFSPDGRYLVRVGSQASDWIDLEAGVPVAALMGSRMVMDVAFSTAPQVAAAVRPDVGVTTWDIPTQTALAALPSDQLLTGVALTRDASRIVGVGNDGVTVWSYTQMERVLRGNVVHGLALSADDRLLAVSVAAGGADAPGVYLVDTATWAVVAYWEPAAPDMIVNTLLFSPDGAAVAVVCSQVGVCLHDTATGELVRVFADTAFARDAAFSPDGAHLAVVGGAYLQVYDVASGDLRYRVGVRSADNGYLRVAFSPDGAQIATANTLDVLLFTMPDGVS